MVIGEILECHNHPQADKLLVSKIKINNNETRQIVSGLKKNIMKLRI